MQGLVKVSIHASAREATTTSLHGLATRMFRSTPPRGRRRGAAGACCATSGFRSTPPRGRRRPTTAIESGGQGFDPRLREGGDSCGPPQIGHHACFDPRLREGGDCLRSVDRPKCREFRSTPPRGRRPLSTSRAFIPFRFRSTPPRGRRPGSAHQPLHLLSVSIHASAREATPIPTNPVFRSMFRSTPPRGRRRTAPMQRASPRGFRSTPPRGRRLSRIWLRAGDRRVSIHASAREATRRTLPHRGHAACFDPRLREGGDLRSSARTTTSWSFDPRLREGGDDRWPVLTRYVRCFDPRLREGGDRQSLLAP